MESRNFRSRKVRFLINAFRLLVANRQTDRQTLLLYQIACSTETESRYLKSHQALTSLASHFIPLQASPERLLGRLEQTYKLTNRHNFSIKLRAAQRRNQEISKVIHQAMYRDVLYFG